MFFNFHTHNKAEKFGIINIFPQEHENIQVDRLYSCGDHPWYYNKNTSSKIKIIEELSINKQIVAIGETGFDSKSELNISEQIKIFTDHVNLSEKYKLPLIIHCVKFHNELINLKKTLNPTQAWIYHGFNTKLSIASELIKANIYLSISENIFRNEEKIKLFFDRIPMNRIFLETDDQDISIEDVYILASKITKFDINTLKSKILKNLRNIGIKI